MSRRPLSQTYSPAEIVAVRPLREQPLTFGAWVQRLPRHEHVALRHYTEGALLSLLKRLVQDELVVAGVPTSTPDFSNAALRYRLVGDFADHVPDRHRQASSK